MTYDILCMTEQIPNSFFHEKIQHLNKNTTFVIIVTYSRL